MSTTDLASRPYTSFTGARSPRYPAPDVARGFMMLLIALANVPVWRMFWTEPAEPTAIGSVWEWVRSALVDQRSYPLFAMLFGFGLMVMARRRIQHDVDAAMEANRTFYDSLPEEHRAAFVAAVRQAATVDARRMVRRRGWWMILFGAVHSMFFFGDIIGAYGLIAVIFAGTFVHQRKVVMWVVGIIIVLLSTVVLGAGGWWFASGGGSLPGGLGGGQQATGYSDLRSPLYPLVGLGLWVFQTPVTLLSTMAVPAAFIGAWVAGTDLLTHPERRQSVLIGGGLAGLAVAALTSISYRALLSGGELPLWLAVLSIPVSIIIGGLAGAGGWLALLAAFAGGARPDGEPLTGVRWLLAAVGKRSMTAYLSQTICFGLLYGGLAVAGAKAPGTVPMALSAVLVWALIAVVCAQLERAGRRGPFERLLRAAVARSARRSRMSELVVPQVAGAPVSANAPADGSQPQPM